MIDLHTHILPGLDDGAPDLETSVLMAAVAAESGVTHLVATPHSNQRGAFENYASPALQVRFDCLCAAVREAGIPLELSLGMEIFGTLAEAMLTHGLVGCIASDVHRPDVRTPELLSAWDNLVEHFSERLSEQLLTRNPELILRSEPLPAGRFRPFF